MSRYSDSLRRGGDTIDRITRKVNVPDPKNKDGRDVWLVDRAAELAEAWHATQPPKSGARGGSSGVRDMNKRKEATAVERRASEAFYRIRRIPEVVAYLDALARDVTFLTEITKERPAVPEETLAGCKSCARAGINEPVFSKSKVSGLCRWCAEKLDEYDDLPIEAVTLRHSRGPKAATLWLQANSHRKDDAPSCANRATVMGYDVRCYRAQAHDGECAGVGVDGKRITWQVDGAAARMSA